MKIVFKYLMLLAMLITTLNASAQENPLDRRLTLNTDQVRMDDALFLISQTGGFNFCYNSNLINKDSLVSVFTTEQLTSELLGNLLANDLDLISVGNHIVIRKKAVQIPSEQLTGDVTISGFIIDDWSGARVTDVTVFEDYQRTTYKTDPLGKFSFSVPRSIRSVALTLNHPSYRDTSFVIVPNSDRRIIIGMSPVVIDEEPFKEEVEVKQVVSSDTPNGESSLEPIENVQAFDDSYKIPLQVSLVPRVGTNGINKIGTHNHVSINILGGTTLGTKGFEFGGVFNMNHKQMYGLQISGAANIIGTEAIGAQFTGGYNYVPGRFIGLQFGGFGNHNGGDVIGMQLAGFYNLNMKDFTGLQIAAGVNYAGGKADGLQIGLVSNLAIKDGGRAQLTFGYNHSGGVSRFQLGAGNYTKELRGMQIGGLFNYAKKVKGVQLGFINISDTINGAALGVINISRSGYMRVEIEASEVLHNNIRFKSGTNYFYTILESGVRWNSAGFAGYGVGGGIGARVEYAKKRMFSEFDTDVFWMNENQAPTFDLNLIVRFSPTIGVRIAGPLEFHVGPTFIYHHSTVKNPDGSYNSELGLNPFYRNARTDMDLLQQMWVGVKGGIQFDLNWRKPKKIVD